MACTLMDPVNFIFAISLAFRPMKAYTLSPLSVNRISSVEPSPSASPTTIASIFSGISVVLLTPWAETCMALSPISITEPE